MRAHHLEHHDCVQVVVPTEIGVVTPTATEAAEGCAARGDLIALGEPQLVSGSWGFVARRWSSARSGPRSGVVSLVFEFEGPVPRVVFESRDLDFEPSPLPEFFEPSPFPEFFEPSPEPRLLLAESPSSSSSSLTSTSRRSSSRLPLTLSAPAWEIIGPAMLSANAPRSAATAITMTLSNVVCPGMSCSLSCFWPTRCRPLDGARFPSHGESLLRGG